MICWNELQTFRSSMRQTFMWNGNFIASWSQKVKKTNQHFQSCIYHMVVQIEVIQFIRSVRTESIILCHRFYHQRGPWWKMGTIPRWLSKWPYQWVGQQWLYNRIWGPKNYSFTPSQDRHVCKIGGLSLNYKKSQAVNFDTIQCVYSDGVRRT